MVIAFVLGAVVVAGGVGYLGVKYHNKTAVIAAVKAEIAKVEGSVVVEVKALVDAIKAKL